MNVENMFEQASRLKLRFGQYNVEDLWDIPLTSKTKVNLDVIARGLNKEIKESNEESFVVQRSSANKELQLKFDLVKYIIDVRLAENKAKEDALKEKQRKDKIRELIAKKQDESLEEKSIDELKQML
ncbi:MAG: hypothetical protein R3230_00050 [Nitrosopumilaceae archaeon]|nr:hypothetical protein [Nitrosopumilaceae archaeon]